MLPGNPVHDLVGALGVPIAQLQVANIFAFNCTELVFDPPALRNVAKNVGDTEIGVTGWFEAMPRHRGCGATAIVPSPECLAAGDNHQALTLAGTEHWNYS